VTEKDNPSQDATDLHLVGRPVELTLLAWWGLKAFGHLAVGETILQFLQEAVEGRRGALIPLLADLSQDATADKILLNEHGSNLIFEGLQLHIDPWCSLVVRWARSPDGSFDRVARDPELFGDLASAPTLGIETADTTPLLHRDHLLPPVLIVSNLPTQYSDVWRVGQFSERKEGHFSERNNNAFRTMKTELELRPIHHQKQVRSDAHIFITVCAYHLLHSIRTTLKQSGITYRWKTIRDLLATHGRVTTRMKTKDGKVIYVRKCSEPEPIQKTIYDALHLKPVPCKPQKVTLKQNS